MNLAPPPPSQRPAPLPPPPGVGSDGPLLSIDDLVGYLNVPKQTIYHWRQNGRGPAAIRLGRQLRFRRSDVEAWLDQQRDTTTPGRRRTRMTDEHLQQVADIYMSHNGHAPTQAVATRLDLPHSTAAKHVMRARERGLLPQTTGGQATNRDLADAPQDVTQDN